jgi:hypothetical protein
MRRKPRTRKPNRHKTKLGLPDLEHVKSAVLVSLRSPESQRSYRHSIDDFVCWYCSEPRLSFNKTVVTRLPDSSRRQTACTWHHQREARSSQTARL